MGTVIEVLKLADQTIPDLKLFIQEILKNSCEKGNFWQASEFKNLINIIQKKAEDQHDELLKLSNEHINFINQEYKKEVGTLKSKYYETMQSKLLLEEKIKLLEERIILQGNESCNRIASHVADINSRESKIRLLEEEVGTLKSKENESLQSKLLLEEKIKLLEERIILQENESRNRIASHVANINTRDSKIRLLEEEVATLKSKENESLQSKLLLEEKLKLLEERIILQRNESCNRIASHVADINTRESKIRLLEEEVKNVKECLASLRRSCGETADTLSEILSSEPDQTMKRNLRRVHMFMIRAKNNY